jgi:hypothetical protein
MSGPSMARGNTGSRSLYWHAVSIPPSDQSTRLGARVEHILTMKAGRLSEIIAEQLAVEQVRLGLADLAPFVLCWTLASAVKLHC